MERYARRRVLAGTVVAAVTLAACGASDDASDDAGPDDGAAGEVATGDDDTTGSTTSTDPGEQPRREPTPVRIVAGGTVAGASSSGPIPVDRTPTGGPSVDVEVEVAPDGIGPLPDDDTGYLYEVRGPIDPDTVVELAGALDLDATSTQSEDGTWIVGPGDGSAATLWVWADARRSWSYDGALRFDEECPPGVDEPGEAVVSDGLSDGDEPAIDEPVEPVDEPIACDPVAPDDVPDAAAAETAARELVRRLVGDVAGLEAEVYVDEWGATVTLEDPDAPGRSWNVGYGGDAVVGFASGSFATPVPVGPFPLVDLDTAVERVERGFHGLSFPVVIDDDAASSPFEPRRGPEVDAPEAPAETASPPVAPVDTVSVTLVDVEPDLWWATDVDGSTWLLPAYRFIDADGGWHVVPAVVDELLVIEPAPDAPDVPDGPDAPDALLAPMAGEMYDAWSAPVRDLVGLPLEQFERGANAAGFDEVRIVYQDGEFLAVTEDFRIGRVNVAVETRDGGLLVVVDAFVEGADQMGETPPTEPTEPTGEPSGEPVAIASVHEQVAFYPACGTEWLDFEGRRWYQIGTADSGAIDPAYEDRYRAVVGVEREPSPVGRTIDGFAPDVVEPGPGDDVGTLVVWEDDVARWVSDSGDLDVWLVLDEVEVDWVC